MEPTNAGVRSASARTLTPTTSVRGSTWANSTLSGAGADSTSVEVAAVVVMVTLPARWWVAGGPDRFSPPPGVVITTRAGPPGRNPRSGPTAGPVCADTLFVRAGRF